MKNLILANVNQSVYYIGTMGKNLNNADFIE